MILKDLLKLAGKYEIVGNEETNVNGIEIDSRNIKEGNAFIAIKRDSGRRTQLYRKSY